MLPVRRLWDERTRVVLDLRMHSKQTARKRFLVRLSAWQAETAERAEDALMTHIRALRLETVEAYRSWCFDHGLNTALVKSRGQQQRERDFVDGLQADPVPASLLEELHAVPQPFLYGPRLLRGQRLEPLHRQIQEILRGAKGVQPGLIGAQHAGGEHLALLVAHPDARPPDHARRASAAFAASEERAPVPHPGAGLHGRMNGP